MSNPALKRVVDGAAESRPQSYQTWNTPGAGYGQPNAGYGQPMPGYGPPMPGYGQAPGYPQAPGQTGGPVRSASSYLDMNDVVTKSAISIVTVIAAAMATWFLFGPDSASDSDGLNTVYGLAIGGAIVGLVLGLVNAFKKTPSAPLVLLYCVAQGIFLGGISGIFEMIYPGIVIQAIVGTFGVFVGMLVVYRTGAIRVTPKFQRWLAAALIGALVLMLFNLVYWLITGEASLLRDGGPLAIGFSILMIGIAAFTLLSDFDMAEQAIRRGAPKVFAWGIAFGLVASLVWLYLEILRLLSYFRE